MYRKLITKVFVVSFVFCTIYTNGFNQDKKELWVTRVQAETSNNLLITLRTENWEVSAGEDLPILITIKNNGSNPIYFVRKEDSEIVNDRGDVLIQAPVPIHEEKAEYDYSFHKIEGGEEYSGQLVISHKLFQKEYDLNIRTGLGFVENISGIDRKLKRDDDPIALRGTLARRMEVIVIGDLRVLVRKK
jgi:hypothetical protein